MATARRAGVEPPTEAEAERWAGLLGQYPEAQYTRDDLGWFIGALRDADDVLRSGTLARLTIRLLARERYPDRPGI